MQEIFLQPGCGEAVTPGAGKRRDKCRGEGKGENTPRFPALSPSWKANWKSERLGCRGRIAQGDLILPHLSECGGWTALDTSTMMSCSHPSSGVQRICQAGPSSSPPVPWWEQSAAHPTSPTLPALGELWAVGDRQEPRATQPSAQRLPILRQTSCVQTSPSERQRLAGRARGQRCALLPASSAEKTLESTCLLTDSCSVGLVF